MPEGPAAEPRRAERRLASSNVSDMGHGPATWLSTAGLSGTTGVWGRRLGSRSSASVASLPSAVRARLAAESSPRWTSAAARAVRRSESSSASAGVEGQAARRREGRAEGREEKELPAACSGIPPSAGDGLLQPCPQREAEDASELGWSALERECASAG